mmetsp:Transcript_5165/g.15143  ORF Transcript_5165/g.15143 Transcript_5165/m.15143 type:complete len:244 (-) Transcript_5165:189-920(-)
MDEEEEARARELDGILLVSAVHTRGHDRQLKVPLGEAVFGQIGDLVGRPVLWRLEHEGAHSVHQLRDFGRGRGRGDLHHGRDDWQVGAVHVYNAHASDDVVHQRVLLSIPRDEGGREERDGRDHERVVPQRAGLAKGHAVADVVGAGGEDIEHARDRFVGQEAQHERRRQSGTRERQDPIIQVHAPVHKEDASHRDDNGPQRDDEARHVAVERVEGVHGGADVPLLPVGLLHCSYKVGLADGL